MCVGSILSSWSMVWMTPVCMFSSASPPAVRSSLLALASLCLAFLNYRGLTIVGWAAVLMTVFIIVPFVVLVGIAAPHTEPKHWVKHDWGAVQWGPFLNVMFW